MFNIRNSIYVTYPEDVHVLSGEHRTVVLTPSDTPIDEMIRADANNPNAKGVVMQFNSYLEMIALEFNGSDTDFYNWLSTETKLWIVVSRDDDYARLFAMMLIELQVRYAISEEHMTELLSIQQLKNYFVGRPVTYDIGDAYRLLKPGLYTAVGGLVDNPQDLPLEYVLYLYKNGYIEKSIADTKVSAIATPMLRGLVHAVTLNIRNDMAIDRKVLATFLGADSLDSIGEAIAAIENNALLRALFFNPKSLDFNDPVLLERIKDWTRLCVTNDIDYPEEHPRHLYEHDLFYRLFETSDVDLVINNIIPFSQHDFISGAGQKFNTLLLTTLYPTGEETAGTFVTKHIADKWMWELVDDNDEIIVTSDKFKTKKAMMANIDSVKSYSQFASTTIPSLWSEPKKRRTQ